MTQTRKPPHNVTPGRLLARRYQFEHDHPDVTIVTPPMSKGGLWEASWTEEDGKPAEMACDDGTAFFDDLEKRFPS